MSHLLQMRGLKHNFLFFSFVLIGSHLLQMRGLKLIIKDKEITEKVASFTDAWSETQQSKILQSLKLVASFTDAWIETNRMGKQ